MMGHCVTHSCTGPFLCDSSDGFQMQFLTSTQNSTALPSEPGDQATLVQSSGEIVIHALLICCCSGFIALVDFGIHFFFFFFQIGCLKNTNKIIV